MKVVSKICEVCNQEFMTTNNNRRFCSSDCKALGQRQWNTSKNPCFDCLNYWTCGKFKDLHDGTCTVRPFMEEYRIINNKIYVSKCSKFKSSKNRLVDNIVESLI